MTNFKGQVTIFIIIGILLVGIVVLFFMLRDDVNLPDIGGSRTKVNPPAFLDSCLEDKIEESIRILGQQGGNINPKLYKTFKFEGENTASDISYLCYNQNYYQPCVNQQPLLIKHLEEEIHDYISDDVEICFTQLGVSLGDQGYVVNSNYISFSVDLTPKRITTDINAEIILTKSGETSKQTNFKIITPTRLYGLGDLAQEIVSQQAEFCNFNELGYMLFYPDWGIKESNLGEGSIIYTLKNRNTKEMFKFAIRGCVIPLGF